MTAAVRTEHFRAIHSLAFVVFEPHRTSQRLIKTRPAHESRDMRIKLCIGSKERITTDFTCIDTIGLFMYILAGKRRFRALLTQDRVLLGRERLLPPFLILRH